MAGACLVEPATPQHDGLQCVVVNAGPIVFDLEDALLQFDRPRDSQPPLRMTCRVFDERAEYFGEVFGGHWNLQRVWHVHFDAGARRAQFARRRR